jgi:predicted RNA-binding protein YlqC (UPF0109 family)
MIMESMGINGITNNEEGVCIEDNTYVKIYGKDGRVIQTFKAFVLEAEKENQEN